jgi:two-component system nitrogen regulation response regulator GlnG
VRQLKSVVRRAVLQAESIIRPEHLVLEGPNSLVTHRPLTRREDLEWEGLSLKDIVRRITAEVERRVLTQVLRRTEGNKAEAARLLQIDYKTIHSKIKQYGIKLYPEVEDEQKR